MILGEYFKVNEVNSIRFVMVPKVLLKNPKYKELSLAAKLAYGLLLDRMELSRKNGWWDDKGCVYVKYAREEIAEDLGVSIPTAVKVMKELAKYDLIQEINLGRGQSKVIYIMKPILEEIDTYKKEPESLETQQTLKILKSSLQKSLSLDFKKFKGKDTYNNDTYKSETYNYYPELEAEAKANRKVCLASKK
ncbi:MAG: hypothetical protein PWQ98_1678 [Moorella sp. (in: firmicutes)]|nr:hypothetical protein [Moorella sp. (in: firmicutes)]